MPELPEVELAGRIIHAALRPRGRRIERATSGVRHIFERGNKARVLRALRGARLRSVRRHGKVLLWRLAGGEGLACHLGMSGKWLHVVEGPRPTHVRLRLWLDDGSQLIYSDPRMFGKVIAMEAAELTDYVAELGPDPIHDGLDVDALRDRFQATTRNLKTTLMDQRVIAGLGNIQVAESLFRARLSPEVPARALRRAQVARLCSAIEESLAATLADLDVRGPKYFSDGGDENPFLVYGREGQPCPRCATTLKNVTLGGRSTVYCPRCQPRGAHT